MKCKLLLVLLVMSVLAVSLAGCGGGEESGPDGVIRLQFWHAMGGPLGDALDALVAEFNEGHSDIEIQSVSMGRYQALSQKIMASVAAGEPPDLAQVYEAWTENLIENGSAEPLSAFVNGPNGLSEDELDDFIPGMIANSTWDGEIYSFPFNKSVRALYWNKGAFADVGLTRAPTNWDEYLEYAKKLTRDTDGDGEIDQWGTAGQISTWMFENLLVQNGGRILTEDGTHAAFDSPEGVQALEFMVELLTEYGKVTAGYEYQNDFQAGKIGMIEGSTVSLAFMEGKYTFDMALAPLPENKERASFFAGTNVVIFADSSDENKRAAWEFVRWFTSPEITARWAAMTGYAPVRRSAMALPIMQERFADVEGLESAFTQLDYAAFEPRSAAWYAGRKYLEESGVEAALRKQMIPGDALAAAAQAVNAELAQ